jgi:hypothetical protein
MECLCCFDNIDDSGVKYRDQEEGEWKTCPYCKECVKYMQKIQFANYVEEVKSETCKVSLERLIKLGPPKKFRDTKVPCNNENGEVYEFDFGSSNLEGVYPEKELAEYTKFLSTYLEEIKK